MTDAPAIAIIGPGVVGTALGVLARRAGLPVTAIGGRQFAAAARAAERIGGDVAPMTIEAAAGAGDLVLLCVSDDAIEAVCGQLADAKAFGEGVIVAHCSGALSSDALSAARELGCSVGSMHPLQTFPTADAAVGRFAGVYCFCEGDNDAVAALTALAEAIGGQPVRVSSAGKALYHAAAVMAGNYTTALLDAAVEMCRQADIDPQAAQAALSVLAAATADNARTMDLAASLTGPIARGDVGTIRRHLAAMADCPADVTHLYCVAGLRTVDLALRKGTIDDHTARELRNTLEYHDERE